MGMPGVTNTSHPRAGFESLSAFAVFAGLGPICDIVDLLHDTAGRHFFSLQRPDAGAALRASACAAFAAARMTSSTRSGWESIGT
jgi:hypothetical protein